MIIPVVILYQIKNTADPINFGLQIGDAHVGRSLLNIDGTPVGDGTFDGDINQNVGTNQSLVNKTLYCTTEIAIEDGNSNVDVTISVTGGVSNYSKENSQTIATTDAVAQYIIQVMFAA